MANPIIVQREEEGNRTEYRFVSLDEALKFIKQSEKTKKSEDGYEVDGAYEIYMPRIYE
jgi:hypothetical protein